jgi:hypothetical protein
MIGAAEDLAGLVIDLGPPSMEADGVRAVDGTPSVPGAPSHQPVRAFTS